MNILPWYRPVGVAILPVSREGGRAGLPKKGKWPPRGTGTTVLTFPCPSQPCFGSSKGARQGNRQGWWKRSIFRWDGRHLTLDQTVGSQVWRHTQGSSGRPASDRGWGSSSKTAPGSLSTGSPARRAPPRRDGSMYSQANVMTLKRCCGKRMGPKKCDSTEESLLRVERCSPKGAPRKPVWWAGEEPEEHNR